MTVDEFMSLREGDQIQGMNGGAGVVSRVNDRRAAQYRDVSVCWGGGDVPFVYSTNQTAWMHWTKVDDDVSTQSESDADGERIS